MGWNTQETPYELVWRLAEQRILGEMLEDPTVGAFLVPYAMSLDAWPHILESAKYLRRWAPSVNVASLYEVIA